MTLWRRTFLRGWRPLKGVRTERHCIENAEAIVLEKSPEEEGSGFTDNRFGYAKTLDTAVYEKNSEAAGEDSKYIFRVMNTDRICLFTNTGKLHMVKAMDIPTRKLRDKGIRLIILSNFTSKDEEIVWMAPLSFIKSNKILSLPGRVCESHGRRGIRIERPEHCGDEASGER